MWHSDYAEQAVLNKISFFIGNGSVLVRFLSLKSLCQEGLVIILSYMPSTVLDLFLKGPKFLAMPLTASVLEVVGSIWFGLSVAGGARGQWDSLLVHPVGLRAHDETKEVLIWDSGPSAWERGRCTPLVIQPGALSEMG